jgi:glycosyltransferase involved in cell wall biosynthesis
MTFRIGMYPDPYSDSRWGREGNPHLYFLAEAISRNGCEIVPVETEEMVEPAKLRRKGIDVLHVHWLDQLFDFFTPLKFFSLLQAYEPFFRKSLRLSAAVKSRFAFSGGLFRVRGARNNVDRWMRRIRKNSIPIVWEIHDLLTHYSTESESLAAFSRFLHSSFFEASAGIVVHEHSCEKDVIRFYGGKKPFAIAQLGDYSIVYGPRVEKEKARKRLGIGKAKTVLAYVGTPRRNRNPGKTALIFSRIAGTEEILLVAGRGVSRYLPGKIHPGTIVLDRFLKKEEIRDIFCASDFIVHDAQKYLTSAVVRTAMSYGVPVISYAYGCAVDMARDAAIFIGEDAKDLEGALRLSFKIDSEKYERLAMEARARNVERKWDQAGVACAALYRHILEGVERNRAFL